MRLDRIAAGAVKGENDKAEDAWAGAERNYPVSPKKIGKGKGGMSCLRNLGATRDPKSCRYRSKCAIATVLMVADDEVMWLFVASRCVLDSATSLLRREQVKPRSPPCAASGSRKREAAIALWGSRLYLHL